MQDLITEYAVVNVADDTTTVFTGRCWLYGIYVNTILSAHACPIEDDTTAIITLVSQAAAGTMIKLPGLQFETSLIVDPHNDGTGNITIMYKRAA